MGDASNSVLLVLASLTTVMGLGLLYMDRKHRMKMEEKRFADDRPFYPTWRWARLVAKSVSLMTWMWCSILIQPHSVLHALLFFPPIMIFEVLHLYNWVTFAGRGFAIQTRPLWNNDRSYPFGERLVALVAFLFFVFWILVVLNSAQVVRSGVFSLPFVWSYFLCISLCAHIILSWLYFHYDLPTMYLAMRMSDRFWYAQLGTVLMMTVSALNTILLYPIMAVSGLWVNTQLFWQVGVYVMANNLIIQDYFLVKFNRLDWKNTRFEAPFRVVVDFFWECGVRWVNEGVENGLVDNRGSFIPRRKKTNAMGCLGTLMTGNCCPCCALEYRTNA